MKPKAAPATELELFQATLRQIINVEHPLVQLADSIDWSGFEAVLADCYSDDLGRPGLATRLMVGLHYLKHAFNESDESVIERWVENPYWQYFCGFDYLQHECPLHPTSLVKWRKRAGSEKIELLLAETVRIAKQAGQVKPRHLKRINVDTTVQEKAIAYPTDARLYTKMNRRLVELAKDRGLKLRQTYVRVAPRTLQKQGRYAHARQFKRARACTKKLKTILGRVVRDIERQVGSDADEELATYLERARRLLDQERDSKNKLYSVWAPEVECISKGKAHKRYEFGCKVSVATTNRNDWVVGIMALHGNPYDGHTLARQVEQVERIAGLGIDEVHVDKGYRGHDYQGQAEVHITGQRLKSAGPALRKRKKRRSAIEPKIGHMKSDNRMERNYLKGPEGDRINALLAGAGANIRKLLGAFWRAPIFTTPWRACVRLFELILPCPPARQAAA